MPAWGANGNTIGSGAIDAASGIRQMGMNGTTSQHQNHNQQQQYLHNDQPAPTQKFPPLLQEHVSSSSAAMAAGDDPVALELLRQIQAGHNLNSVLHNPISPSYAMSFTDGLTLLGNMFERDEFQGSPPLPSIIPAVALEDFANFRENTSMFTQVFLANHKDNNYNQQHEIQNGLVLREARNGTSSHAQYQKKGDMLSPSVQRASEFERTRGSRDSATMLSACFEEVPSHFFSRDFSLDDGSLFSECDSPSGSARVQEQLCNWLDLVEVCLWSQTTSQAESFFGALDDLRELQGRVTAAADQVIVLRGHVHAIQRRMVDGNLKMLRKKRRLHNVKAMSRMLCRIQEVQSTLPLVRTLLSDSQDFAGALILIEGTQEILDTELKGIHCLRVLGRQLTEFRDMIGEQLGRKFIDLALQWEDDMGDEEEDQDSIGGETGLVGDGRGADEGRRDAGLCVLLRGLLRMKDERVRGILRQYKVRILQQVAASWDRTLESALDAIEEEGEASSSTADVGVEQPSHDDRDSGRKSLKTRLHELDTRSFVACLGLLLSSLQAMLQRAKDVHMEFVHVVNEHWHLMDDGAIENENESGLDTTVNNKEGLPTTLSRFLDMSKDIYLRVADEGIQVRVHNELDARRRSHVHMHMTDLCELWDVVLAFITKAEATVQTIEADYQWLDLRASLVTLPKSYLSNLHTQHMEHIVGILDEDDWELSEVPYQVQMIVRHIESCKMPQPNSTGRNGSIGGGVNGPVSGGGGGPGHISRELWIQRRQYRMVKSVSVLLNYIERYLSFAQSFGTNLLTVLAADALAKLLDKFGEHTDKLIVGAGAILNGKLATIKTKHIARSSQALSIVLALLTPIEKLLLGCVVGSTSNAGVTTKTTVPEKSDMSIGPGGEPASTVLTGSGARVQAIVEQVRDNFNKHRNRVFSKAVDLVDSVLRRECAKMATTVNWDARNRDGGGVVANGTSGGGGLQHGKPQGYMADIIKSIETFYKQLKSHLPPEQLQQVFDLVFDLVNTRIPVLFADVNPSTPTGRSRVRIDLRRLVSSLRQLRGLNGPGQALELFIQEKYETST